MLGKIFGGMLFVGVIILCNTFFGSDEANIKRANMLIESGSSYSYQMDEYKETVREITGQTEKIEFNYSFVGEDGHQYSGSHSMDKLPTDGLVLIKYANGDSMAEPEKEIVKLNLKTSGLYGYMFPLFMIGVSLLYFFRNRIWKRKEQRYWGEAKPSTK